MPCLRPAKKPTIASKMTMIFIAIIGLIFSLSNSVLARNGETPQQQQKQLLGLLACQSDQLKCILDYTYQNTDAIEDQRWKDQTLRDLVMRYADAGYAPSALPIIPQINNPDTRSMAIRAAGMGLAKHSTAASRDSDTAYFTALKALANDIAHDGAREIAFTYIAMGETYAGQDEAATQTAMGMKNGALRNKALAESAEIQAERGDQNKAMESISHIDDPAFKDKAYTITAAIFIKGQKYDEALFMASHIENPYKQSKILLNLSAAQINMRDSETK